MKQVLVAILYTLLASSSALAAEIIITESADVTSKDLPLKFTLEKTTWRRDHIYIFGTVKNTGTTKYRYVQVIFTVKDAEGKFIGRRTVFVSPFDIGPGQVGYIEGSFVECEGRKPSKVEYSVIGEE